MTAIPPTTTYQIEQPDESPCCGADLVLVSPPIGYECRECGETYTLDEAGGEDTDEICGAELASGGICERLASECPYDSHRE